MEEREWSHSHSSFFLLSFVLIKIFQILEQHRNFIYSGVLFFPLVVGDLVFGFECGFRREERKVMDEKGSA